MLIVGVCDAVVAVATMLGEFLTTPRPRESGPQSSQV